VVEDDERARDEIDQKVLGCHPRFFKFTSRLLFKSKPLKATMASPLTPEHVAEWESFGPKLKGKPTPEQQIEAQERKTNCTAMKKRLAAELNDPNNWTEKKIEKELDRLVEEAADPSNKLIVRPAYLDPPSGTRDFYPDDMKIRNWLFGNMRAAALKFGFSEYDAPVLEHVELYERKAGEEIVDQMYSFHDKEGDHVTLRPEMTPTLARMVLNKTNLQTGDVRITLPLKWFSIPQCWRFETTQRGRKREHYQWNMDIVGVEHVNAELELLAAACEFFRRLDIGPDIVGIKVNSRAVLEALLANHGINKGTVDEDGGDVFSKACVIIDKLDKIGGAAVTELLGGIGVSEDSARDILIALQSPSIDALAEIVGGQSDAIDEVKRLFDLAKDYGIADYLVFDASVVRGLAYYTGIVWEAFDRRGELRAIMGGGRYDRLLELYGGEKCQIPCVGFGFGDCVIMELLQDLKKVPDLSTGVDYAVCAYSPEMYGKAASISAGLRDCGWSVDLMPTPKKKVANSFKHADQIGARRMVFVAPSEIERGVVRVKDLRVKDSNGEGVQVDVPLDELNTIDDLIAQGALK
jgi:histidyl-tRNA synthetase